jgi:hypothetical protein
MPINHPMNIYRLSIECLEFADSRVREIAKTNHTWVNKKHHSKSRSKTAGIHVEHMLEYSICVPINCP